MTACWWAHPYSPKMKSRWRHIICISVVVVPWAIVSNICLYFAWMYQIGDYRKPVDFLLSTQFVYTLSVTPSQLLGLLWYHLRGFMPGPLGFSAMLRWAHRAFGQVPDGWQSKTGLVAIPVFGFTIPLEVGSCCIPERTIVHIYPLFNAFIF